MTSLPAAWTRGQTQLRGRGDARRHRRRFQEIAPRGALGTIALVAHVLLLLVPWDRSSHGRTKSNARGTRKLVARRVGLFVGSPRPAGGLLRRLTARLFVRTLPGDPRTEFFRFSCSSTARTMRKPTKSPSVSHQMLCGRCGSWLHPARVRRRSAWHCGNPCASSPHEPPRTTFGKRSSPGRITGDQRRLVARKRWRRRPSRSDRGTIPRRCRTCRTGPTDSASSCRPCASSHPHCPRTRRNRRACLGSSPKK